ncbi:MFS family permease [Lipingzhangella halophila]|uniref:MFS family permease n=1 Tax=Lipingzhangella halophila TaxID=1783352 RepID=A0A7W7RJH9_9ACTN|nr:MFS transporter [Lipingzhangella halophila]MBB4933153.1 MFS family permease [Lipingzhangella halophila]
MTKTASRGRRGLGVAPLEGITGRESAPFGWAPLIILFVVGLADRIETYIASGALPLLQAEWGFSDTMGGMIMTAPLILGAVALVPAGYVSDRFNRTGLIAVVVGLWSLITLGSAVAPIFAIFLVTRAILGTADTIDNPASSSLLADYYPPKTRAKVFGYVRLTNYAGIALGTILGGVVGEAFGWRWAFACMVIPGLLVAYLCWRLREPVRGFLDEVIARNPSKPIPIPESDTGAQPDRPPGSGHPPKILTQLAYIWQVRTLRYVCLGLALLTLGLQGIFYWIPSLLTREFALTAGEASTLSSMVSLFAICTGAIFGGWIGGRMHGAVRGGRLLASGLGLFIGSAWLGVALAMDNLVVFMSCLLLSSFFSSIAIPNTFASIADVVAANSRGIGFAVLNFLVVGGGALGPVVVGAISDAYGGSLLTGMYALLPAMLVAGLFVLFGRPHFDREAKSVIVAARPYSPPYHLREETATSPN